LEAAGTVAYVVPEKFEAIAVPDTFGQELVCPLLFALELMDAQVPGFCAAADIYNKVNRAKVPVLI
jgi:hypothetical protein